MSNPLAKFMWLFGRVERLQQRLRVMIFIGNFNENIRTIGPQLKAVISASMSIRNSEKLKKILEIILAFGNYMNSGKRGSVYGFKLTSLEALVETKSTDKSQNLLHYICNVVHQYFQDVSDFMCEIRYVDQGKHFIYRNFCFFKAFFSIKTLKKAFWVQ